MDSLVFRSNEKKTTIFGQASLPYSVWTHQPYGNYEFNVDVEFSRAELIWCCGERWLFFPVYYGKPDLKDHEESEIANWVSQSRN